MTMRLTIQRTALCYGVGPELETYAMMIDGISVGVVMGFIRVYTLHIQSNPSSGALHLVTYCDDICFEMWYQASTAGFQVTDDTPKRNPLASDYSMIH